MQFALELIFFGNCLCTIFSMHFKKVLHKSHGQRAGCSYWFHVKGNPQLALPTYQFVLKYARNTCCAIGRDKKNVAKVVQEGQVGPAFGRHVAIQ